MQATLKTFCEEKHYVRVVLSTTNMQARFRSVFGAHFRHIFGLILGGICVDIVLQKDACVRLYPGLVRKSLSFPWEMPVIYPTFWLKVVLLQGFKLVHKSPIFSGISVHFFALDLRRQLGAVLPPVFVVFFRRILSSCFCCSLPAGFWIRFSRLIFGSFSRGFW